MAEIDYDDFDILLYEDDEYVSNREPRTKTLKDKLNIVNRNSERKVEKIIDSLSSFEEEPNYSLSSKHNKTSRCYIDEWDDYGDNLECDGDHYEECSIFEDTRYGRKYPDDFEVVYDYRRNKLEPDGYLEEDERNTTPPIKRNFLDKILGR